MPTRSRKSRRRSARRAVQSSSPESPSSLTTLWVLRAMVPLGGYRSWLELEYFKDSSNTLAVALGFHNDLDDEDDNLSGRTALTRLRRQHAQAEKGAARVVPPRALAANCARIAALIGLDAVSQQLLAFAVLLHQDALLVEATELLGLLGRKQIYTILATLLSIPESAIRQALAPALVWLYFSTYRIPILSPKDACHGNLDARSLDSAAWDGLRGSLHAGILRRHYRAL